MAACESALEHSAKATSGYIRVTHVVEEAPEGGFVSFCPELGSASQGESVGEALNNLRDATYPYLNTIEQLRHRKRLFQERGITVYPVTPRDPVHFEVKPPRQAASVLVVPVRREPDPARREPELSAAVD